MSPAGEWELSENFPAKFTGGDLVKWRLGAGINHIGDEVTNENYTVKYYFRCNVASEGVTVTGTSYGQGWEFEISASDSLAMDPGNWHYQALGTRTSPDDTVTLARGSFEVLRSLAYTGTPGALDLRTQVEKDYDAVRAAIRAMIDDKAKSYTIGTRTYTRIDLPDLIARESQLKAQLMREQRQSLRAQGLGDPNILRVRF
jgi:hypothetical protein